MKNQKSKVLHRKAIAGVSQRAIINLSLLLLVITVQAFANDPKAPDTTGETYRVFVADKETLIPTTDLIKKYKWNGLTVMWRGGKSLSGVKMSNGSVWVFSPNATDSSTGIPFSFKEVAGDIGFGEICIGNIRIEGKVTFVENGLLLDKGTKLYYPMN